MSEKINTPPAGEPPPAELVHPDVAPVLPAHPLHPSHPPRGQQPWWSWLFFYVRPPEGLTPAHWRMLGLLGAAYMVNSYDIGLLALALPQIQAGLAIPEDQIGALTGLIRLGVIPALILTMLADVVGRRRLLLITILGFTVSTFATAFARTSLEFGVLQFFARMFIYAEEMLAIVVIAEELDAKARGWGIGILAALGAMGHGVAAGLYSFVGSIPYGWRGLYLLGILPLLVLTWFRRNLRETKRFADFFAERGEPTSVAEYLRPIRDLLSMYPGRLAVLASAVFPYWFLTSTALQFQSKFLQETHGYSPGGVALLFILGGVFAVIGNIAAGSASDRYGRRLIMTSALLVNLAGTALFYHADTWAVPPAWCLMLFAYFGGEVLFAALATELFPTSYRSTASGARSIMGAFGGASGLVFEGWAFNVFGSHQAAITVMLTAALIPPFVIWFFVPETATRELEEIAPEL